MLKIIPLDHYEIENEFINPWFNNKATENIKVENLLIKKANEIFERWGNEKDNNLSA